MRRNLSHLEKRLKQVDGGMQRKWKIKEFPKESVKWIN